MPLIDDRARVLGKVNLIDAFVGLLFLGLIPLGYGALVLFRAPVPSIASIEPPRVTEGEAVTVTVVGHDLRPFLRARIGSVESGGFLVQSPMLAEVKVPPTLPVGTYDLVLFDETQELVRLVDALTIVGADEVVAMLQVRFFAQPEVFDRVHIGDFDVGDEPPAVHPDRASLNALEDDRRTFMARGIVAVAPGRSFEVQQTMAVADATLRVPVRDTPKGWSYRGKPVKVGAPFVFETAQAFMEGYIWDLAIETAAPHAESNAGASQIER